MTMQENTNKINLDSQRKVFSVDDIEILYRDEHLIIVNKPSWLIVHPFKRFHHEKVNLMKLLRDKIGQYVYPVHRLDRQVSGAIAFALSPVSAREIQKLWHNDQTKKQYLTLCKGSLKGNGQFNFPLRDGKYKKKSLTLYSVLYDFGDCSLVEVEIRTGRRHQIRRHFSRRMHHIVGDRRYGHKDFNDSYLESHGLNRIFLHAYKLRLPNPEALKLIEVMAPLPDNLKKILIQKGMPSFELSKL